MGAAEEFGHSWTAFVTAFETGDDGASLEALRRWIASWDECVTAGDTTAFGRAYHEDVVAELHIPFPGMGGESEGLDELRSRAREIPDVMTRFHFEVAEFARSGNRWAASGVVRSRGRYSGLVLKVPISVMWTMRASKIVRVDAFGGRKRALVALDER